jgi:hypothetical protein
VEKIGIMIPTRNVSQRFNYNLQDLDTLFSIYDLNQTG